MSLAINNDGCRGEGGHGKVCTGNTPLLSIEANDIDISALTYGITGKVEDVFRSPTRRIGFEPAYLEGLEGRLSNVGTCKSQPP